MKTCLRKTDEAIWDPPPLSTNPLFLSNFFITPLFVQIPKTRMPPPLCFFLGRGGWEEKTMIYFFLIKDSVSA